MINDITTIMGLQMAVNYRGNIIIGKNLNDPDEERKELIPDLEYGIVVAQ